MSVVRRGSVPEQIDKFASVQASRLLGKLATVAQFAFVLSLAGYPRAVPILLAPTVVLSVWAGIDYVRSFRSTVAPLPFVNTRNPATVTCLS